MTRLYLAVAIGIFAAFVPAASAQWNEQVLYSFQNKPDGAVPAGGVIFGKDGNLYGATTAGGQGIGAVFQLAKSGTGWIETVLYSFQGKPFNDGDLATSGLVMDKKGSMYGVAAYGGSGNCTLLGEDVGCGIVYEVSKRADGTWIEKVIYSFQGGNDGYVPSGDLVFDTRGNLYGATQFGGGKGTTCDQFYGGNCGTVFELSPPTTKGRRWTERVLHSFAGGSDGATPNGSLVIDSKGMLYGTTPIGGSNRCDFGNGIVGCGIVFSLTPTQHGPWRETVLHRFKDGNDGAGPGAGLTFGKGGALFGTAGGGGTSKFGVVFQMTRGANHSWTEKAVYNFTGGGDGRGPSGPVTIDPSGALIGTVGPGPNYGAVYELQAPHGKKDWSFSTLYNFQGSPDGAFPTFPITLDSAGDIYSTTEYGGTGSGYGCSGGCGTVFELSPP